MRKYLRDKADRRSRLLDRRLSEARGDFDRIARHIAETYAPKRILQWGSLIDDSHFREYSDIDIAVEGVTSAEEFFSILRDIEGMTDFPVDLVQMETIHPAFAESIRERGRVVYER